MGRRSKTQDYYLSDEGIVIDGVYSTSLRAEVYPVRKPRHKGSKDILFGILVFLLTPIFIIERRRHERKTNRRT